MLKDIIQNPPFETPNVVMFIKHIIANVFKEYFAFLMLTWKLYTKHDLLCILGIMNKKEKTQNIKMK